MTVVNCYMKIIYFWEKGFWLFNVVKITKVITCFYGDLFMIFFDIQIKTILIYDISTY